MMSMEEIDLKKMSLGAEPFMSKVENMKGYNRKRTYELHRKVTHWLCCGLLEDK